MHLLRAMRRSAGRHVSQLRRRAGRPPDAGEAASRKPPALERAPVQGMTAPPRILAIAGSDSSGGAGIQADIKTITMLGGYAMTAITAVTAQNTIGVQAIESLRPALVLSQIESCIADVGVDAIKIGMLGSPEVAESVADRLVGVDVPVVFDPVMISTSGATLVDDRTIASFERLIGIATLTTPNAHEAESLGGMNGWLERKVPF